MEIKRIRAIQTLKKNWRTASFFPSILSTQLYIRTVLAMQIIDIDLQLIEAKFKTFLTHLYIPHLSAAHSLLPQPFSAQPPAMQPPALQLAPLQPLEINDIIGILT